MNSPRALPALLLLLCAGPSLAQNPSARPAAERKRAEEAGEQSRRMTAADGDVEYAEVLAKPDDVGLNYRFALTQVRRGDLKGASATLERILLVDPGLAKVRLFYGIVLLRLDNLVESERELAALLAQDPPEDVRREAEAYLKEVRKRRKRTHLSGRLGAGIQYDDNRNAGPALNQRLFNDAPLLQTGDAARRDDTSAIFLGNVEARHDLPSPAGHQLFGTFDYYRAEQTSLKTLNLAAYSFAAGGVYRTPYFSLTPQVVYDQVLLAQAMLLRNRGGDLRLDKKLGPGANAHLGVRAVRQIFNDTALVPTAHERTGLLVDATAGADCLLSPRMRLGAELNYAVKHAEQAHNEYYRWGGRLSHVWLLGKGTFLLTGAGVTYDRYPTPDRFVSRDLRKDTIYTADAGYGVPLGVLAAPLSDLILTLNYGYYQATSSVRNYAYTNNKASALLTYKWEIGI